MEGGLDGDMGGNWRMLSDVGMGTVITTICNRF